MNFTVLICVFKRCPEFISSSGVQSSVLYRPRGAACCPYPGSQRLSSLTQKPAGAWGRACLLEDVTEGGGGKSHGKVAATLMTKAAKQTAHHSLPARPISTDLCAVWSPRDAQTSETLLKADTGPKAHSALGSSGPRSEGSAMKAEKPEGHSVAFT